MKKRIAYAFDLDGTVTKEELLPLIAGELGLGKEMKILTGLTLTGVIGFEDSFRLRFHILKSVPLAKIHNIVRAITIDPFIEQFIKANSEDCFIVTGNLDIWIKPFMERLKCKFYTSTAKIDEEKGLLLDSILLKSSAIREIHEQYETVVAIGESFNDLPMLEEADIGIAYGGVHQPIAEMIRMADHICHDGESLCRLLNEL